MVEQTTQENFTDRQEKIWQDLVRANDSSIFPDLRLTTPTPDAVSPAMESKIAAVHQQYADAGLDRDRAERIADEIAGRSWFLFEYASRDEAGREELIAQVTDTPSFLEEAQKYIGQGVDAVTGAVTPDIGLDNITDIKDAAVAWADFAVSNFKDVDGINPEAIPSHDQLLAMAYETLKAEQAAAASLAPEITAPQASMGWLQQVGVFFSAVALYLWNNTFGSGETDFSKIMESRRDWALEGNPVQEKAREWDSDLEHRLAVQDKARDDIEGMTLTVSDQEVTITPTLARQLTGVDARGKLIDRRLPGTQPDDNSPMAQAIAARYAKENPGWARQYEAMADKYGEPAVVGTGLAMTAGAWHIAKPVRRTAQVTGFVTGLGGEAKGLRGRAFKVAGRVVPFGAAGLAIYDGFSLYDQIWQAVEAQKITAEEAREIQYSASIALALDPTDVLGGEDLVAETALTEIFGERTWQLVEKAGLVQTTKEVLAQGEAARIRKAYETIDGIIPPDKQMAFVAGQAEQPMTLSGMMASSASIPLNERMLSRTYDSYAGTEVAIRQYLANPEAFDGDDKDSPVYQVIQAIRTGPFEEQEAALERERQGLRADFELGRLQRFGQFLTTHQTDIRQAIAQTNDGAERRSEYRAFNNLMMRVTHQLNQHDGSIDNLHLDSEPFKSSDIVSTYFERFQTKDETKRQQEEERLQQDLKDQSTDTHFRAFLREQVKAIDAYQSVVSRVNAEDRASGADQSLVPQLFEDSRITQARDNIKIPQSLIRNIESRFYDERTMLIDLSGRTMGPARRELFHVALANGLDAADFHEQLFKYQSELANSDLTGQARTAVVDGYFISGDNEGRGRVYIEKPSEEAIEAMHFRRDAQKVLFQQVKLYDEHIATNFNAAHFEIGLVERMQQGETISDADIDQVIDQLSPEHIRRALGVMAPFDDAHPTHNKIFAEWAKEHSGNRQLQIKRLLETNIETTLKAAKLVSEEWSVGDLENLTLTDEQRQAIAEAGILDSGVRDHVRKYLMTLRDGDMQQRWVDSYKDTAMAFVETTAALKPFAQDLAQAEYAIRDLFMFPNKKELKEFQDNGHYNPKWDTLIDAAQEAQDAFKAAFGENADPQQVKLLLNQEQYAFFTGAFRQYFDQYREQYLGLPEEVREVTQQHLNNRSTGLEPGAQPMSFNGFSPDEMQAMLQDAVYGSAAQGRIHLADRQPGDRGDNSRLRSQLAAVGVMGGEHQRAGETLAPSEALPSSLTGGHALGEAADQTRRMV